MILVFIIYTHRISEIWLILGVVQTYIKKIAKQYEDMAVIYLFAINL